MPVEVETVDVDHSKCCHGCRVMPTICGNCASGRSPVIGRYVIRFLCRATSFDVFGGGKLAAQSEVPSFSRSGSSVNRMIFPCFRSAKLRWNRLKFTLNLLKSRSAAAFQSGVLFKFRAASSIYIFRQRRFVIDKLSKAVDGDSSDDGVRV